MLKNKKGFLITITLLIIAVMGGSAIAYTLAGNGGKESETIKTEVNQASKPLEGNLGFMEYVSNIDLIIEDSQKSDYQYKIVHIIPKNNKSTTVSKYVSDDVFRTLVINANKERDAEMPTGRVTVTRLELNSDVKTSTEIGNDTAGGILGAADLIYIESPDYNSYRGMMSDDIYLYLSGTYLTKNNKPMILDKVTDGKNNEEELVANSVKAYVNEVAENYIYSPVFAWPKNVDGSGMQSANDFFAGKDASNYFQYVVNDEQKATGKVLVLKNARSSQNDWILSNFVKDNIKKIYYGKEKDFPEDFTITKLDIGSLTSEYLKNNKFDFIIIENSAMDTVMADGLYQDMVALANGKQYIIFDGSNVIEKKSDEGGNNYLKLLESANGFNSSRILVVDNGFFDGDARKADGAKKIADLINGTNYRGSDNTDRNGKKFRVLEIQPCYPIDLARAKKESDMGDARSNNGLKGNYYTNLDQDRQNIGKSVDEVSEKDEYYAFELSASKIAAATGLKTTQIEVDSMSTDEFISSKEVVLDTYDLVYIGGNASALLPVEYAQDYKGSYSMNLNYKNLFTEHIFVPSFVMYSHTGYAYLLSTKGSYDGAAYADQVYSPNKASSSIPYGQLGNEKTSTVTNGNDLTYSKYEELINYIDAGMPIIFSDEISTAFEKIYNKARIEQLSLHDIDPDSNMYNLLNYAYKKYNPAAYKDVDDKVDANAAAAPNIVWNFDKSSERKSDERHENKGNIKDKDAKFKYLTLFSTESQDKIKNVIQHATTRPSLRIIEAPADYEKGNEATYNTKKDNCMNIKVKLVCMKSDKVQNYAIRLYVDKNGNGLYGGNGDADELANEKVDYYHKANDTQETPKEEYIEVPAYNKNDESKNFTSGEITLTYKFDMDDFYGIVNWKAEAVLMDGTNVSSKTAMNSTQCDVKRGYAYYKREDNVEKKDVRILQLMPLDSRKEKDAVANNNDGHFGYQDAHTLYMCTECQLAGYRATYNISGPGGDGLYDQTTGIRKQPVNSDITDIGLHEHKFGIVSYDSSISGLTSADKKYNNGCDNWNDNLADQLADDYNFDLDIMLIDEYHKASWIVQANTKSDGSYRKMDDTEGLPSATPGYDDDKVNYRKDENGNEITPIKDATWVDYYTAKRDAYQEKYEDAVLKLQKSKIEDSLDGILDELKEQVGSKGVKGRVGIVNADAITDWQEHHAYYNYFFYYIGYYNLNTDNPNYKQWSNYLSKYKQWIELHDQVVKYQKLYKQYAAYACTSDQWLYNNYDMVVLGFAQDFGGQDLSDTECNDLKTYIQEKGGTVLLTHDTTTRFNDAGSIRLTNNLRRVFGLDRFHVETVDSGLTTNTVSDRTALAYYFYDQIGKGVYGPVILKNQNAVVDIVLGENEAGLVSDGNTYYHVQKCTYEGNVSNGQAFSLTFNIYDNMNDYKNGIKSSMNNDQVLWKQFSYGPNYVNGLKYDSGKQAYFDNTTAKLETITLNESLKLPVFTFSDDNKYFMTTKNVFSAGKTSETLEDRIIWQNAVKNQTAVGNYGQDFNVINLVGNTDAVSMMYESWVTPNYRYVEMNIDASITYAIGTTFAVEDIGGTSRATQINDGVITVYPFQLDADMAIAPTHFQTFATDLEDPNMTVWYALASSNHSKSGKSAKKGNSFYAASPNDGMDNYFLYTYKSGKGTVNYCGAGHSVVTGPGKNNLYERLLYINLVTDSVKNSASRPKITLYDKNGKKITKDSTGSLKMDEDGNYVYKLKDKTEIPEFNFDVKFSSLADQLEDIYMFYDLDNVEGTFDAHKNTCTVSNNGKINGLLSNKYKQNESHVLIHHYDSNELKEVDSKGNALTAKDKMYKFADEVRAGKYKTDTLDRLELNAAMYKDVLSESEQAADGMTQKEKDQTLDYFAKYGGSYTYLVIWAKDKAGKTASVRIRIEVEKKLFDLTDNTTIQLPDYQFKAMYTTMDITDRTKYNL